MREDIKTCSKCKRTLPLVDENGKSTFYKGNGKDGLYSWCKKCVSDNNVEYYAKPEVKARVDKNQDEYRANPENKIRKIKYDSIYIFCQKQVQED